MRELIYFELLEYHPALKQELLKQDQNPFQFQFPSAIDSFNRKINHLENGGAPPASYRAGGLNSIGQSVSLPKEKVQQYQQEAAQYYR